jgi:hypothetical protein|tara:strand:+ start:475 stop:993 length:519 start_codon:yes stop_codon:yes gene_type:complete
MYKYLTKNGKTSITGGSVLPNKTKSDTKPTAKNNKMLQYIEDHQIVYDGKEATKADAEAAAKRIDSYKNQMSKQDEYNRYFNKKSPKYYKNVRDPSFKKKSTSPVEIDYDLGPRTAYLGTRGLWPKIKESSIYKLLDNPKVMGVELGEQGIMEAIQLLQNSGLLKDGGKVKK